MNIIYFIHIICGYIIFNYILFCNHNDYILYRHLCYSTLSSSTALKLYGFFVLATFRRQRYKFRNSIYAAESADANLLIVPINTMVSADDSLRCVHDYQMKILLTIILLFKFFCVMYKFYNHLKYESYLILFFVKC